MWGKSQEKSHFKLLLSIKFQPEVLIGKPRNAAASLGTRHHADLQKVGLVDILQCNGFLINGGSQGIEPDRTAVVIIDYGAEHLSVERIKAEFIDFHARKRFIGNLAVDSALSCNLRKVTHTTEEPVGDSRRSSGTRSNLLGTAFIYLNAEYTGTALNDKLQFFGCIELQAKRNPETVS